MKIVFFGSGKFGLPTLKKLIGSEHELLAVVTQPDRKKGRGWSVLPTPVNAFVEQAVPAVDVFQPEEAADKEFLAALKSKEADVFVVVDYGEFLSRDLLGLPGKLCINLHPSLLPKYRGAAPVNWAIINGEEETGNTVIELVEKMDAGGMIVQEKTTIKEEETAVELGERLSQSGGDLVLKALEIIGSGETRFTPQDENAVSFAPKLEKKHGLIEWKRSAPEVVRKVRGVQPWPGAFTYLEGKMLKILKAKEVAPPGQDGEPGSIVDEKGFIVKAGEGAVQVEEVQLEGKKAMSREGFLRGHRLERNTVLNEDRN
ncbi:MAG: methionyl-tRNA formyltransferase [Candidatus Omnitrophota bacterium]